MLRLLSLLQLHRDWTGPALAERLGVSTRTIRTDIERLRVLGYPVDATSGVAGGYRLGAGSSLPPLLLDDDEAVAVAVGLATAANGAVTGIEETSVRALAKLEQVLPSRLRHRVRALTAATVHVPGTGRPTVDATVLTAIATAIRASERLRFDYETHSGATKQDTNAGSDSEAAGPQRDSARSPRGGKAGHRADAAANHDATTTQHTSTQTPRNSKPDDSADPTANHDVATTQHTGTKSPRNSKPEHSADPTANHNASTAQHTDTRSVRGGKAENRAGTAAQLAGTAEPPVGAAEQRAGRVARREVEPHRLVHWGGRWYLVAWDIGRTDWRTFRVDRMTPRTPNGARFTPRIVPETEVAERVQRGVGAATWRYRARVRVAAPATDVRSRLPAAVTVEPDGPNHCVIQVGSDTPHMLTLYLGLLDVDFEVLDAPELAAHLLTTAERFRKAAGEN